jgi:cytoskeletal protein RodZ
MKKYELTPTHKKKLKPWANKWIKNAMSTKPMDEKDKKAMRKAIKGLYKAANLTPPPDNRIVFVPSPFVARFAGGFAAAIWWLRKNPGKTTDDATSDATSDATRDATDAATDAATYGATRDATSGATDAATYGATRAATYAATIAATYAATIAATDDATRDATDGATRAATYDATRGATYAATIAATDGATRDATSAATYDATSDAIKNYFDTKKWYRLDIKGMATLSNALKLGEFGLKCAHNASYMWNGGNQWSYWVAFLSFFRHVAKLKLDYSKWDHYEKAAIHGSYRIMHKEFCIISDRPKTLLVNDENQPHCSTGPFCEWRDGSALYALNGVRVPMWVVETPINKIKKEDILNETNTDVRRELIKRIGIEKTIDILGAKVIDTYKTKTGGKYELLEIDYDGRSKRPYLKFKCPSSGAVYIEGARPEHKTAKEAYLYQHKLKEEVKIVWER